ncbi:MAG: aminotransferase class I/II-fold pyridoxal phosphate-dependent enzyme, partial [Anaplasmataceae bacterium]|nr:aminotransferase class I/II-fold pyridoxal phosphate-dependent enzyme [Anaplasmataceae bacterium]
MSKFIKDRLKTINPYIPPVKKSGINLNSNENPYTAYYNRDISISTNLYPYNILKLKEKLSGILTQPLERLNLSCGLDDGINRIIKTYCETNHDSITIIIPTFAFYKNAAQINGIHLNEIPFDKNFNFPLEKLLNLQTKVIFICNPNNPSGNYIDLKNIEILCEKYKDQAIIAVDEAYIEFMQDESLSAINLLDKFDNLIVMRTMSKAIGLAGIRVGILISNKEIIEDLNKFTLPYPLPSPTVEIALSALSDNGMINRRYNINYINF